MLTKSSRTSFFYIVFSLCLFAAFSASFTSSNAILDLKIGDKVVYDVMEASDTSNLFFGAWPPGDYLGNWTVNTNDKVSFELTNVTFSEKRGTLDLGNYSFSDVRTIDIASALLLSIYPWNGGFFANTTNWEGIMTIVEDTNTTVTIVEGLEYTINNETQLFDVYLFNTENYYGQFSSLYYDVYSGILLNATTSFTNYSLSLLLSSSSFELQNTTFTSYYFFSSVSLILIIAVIIRNQSKNL